ncbi:MAG TPA: preprotein translocase subunit Sec61beta [Candidatus Thermoplasmatota archaeon]|nr:preprotein translocase subunit Sec61beta [Candidatus Thermoplasmatota archaeon]
MSKQQKGAGFQQAAGLIRYFDAEEDTTLKINPTVVLVMAFGTAVFVEILNLAFPAGG